MITAILLASNYQSEREREAHTKNETHEPTKKNRAKLIVFLIGHLSGATDNMMDAEERWLRPLLLLLDQVIGPRYHPTFRCAAALINNRDKRHSPSLFWHSAYGGARMWMVDLGRTKREIRFLFTQKLNSSSIIAALSCLASLLTPPEKLGTGLIYIETLNRIYARIICKRWRLSSCLLPVRPTDWAQSISKQLSDPYQMDGSNKQTNKCAAR